MIFTYLAAQFNISEHALRQAVSHEITVHDLPGYYFSSDLIKAQRMVLFDTYVGVFQDLRIISRLFPCGFIEIDGECNRIFSGTYNQLNPMYEVGNQCQTIRLITSPDKESYLHEKGLPHYDYYSSGIDNDTTNLSLLLSLVVFHSGILLFPYEDPWQLLYNCISRSSVRIGFVVYDTDDLLHPLGRVGCNWTMCYILLYDRATRLWSIKSKGNAITPHYYYISSLHWDMEDVVESPSMMKQLMQKWVRMEKEEKEELVWHALHDDFIVIINARHGTVEVLLPEEGAGVSEDHCRDIELVVSLLPGFFVVTYSEHVPLLICQTRIAECCSLYSLLYPDTTVVVGGQHRRGTRIERGEPHFFDWRMVYLSKSVGFIPDCHNEFTKIAQADPMDITFPRISFVNRWSPDFHRTHKTQINIDFIISGVKEDGEEDMDIVVDTDDGDDPTLRVDRLRPLRHSAEKLMRLPFCPLFIEPNAFLDRLDRFVIQESPFMNSQGVIVPYNLGLFARRTLLKGVFYPQLKYCGQHITPEEADSSDSKYIWKLSSGVLIDAQNCQACPARFINSADYRDPKDGAYRIQKKRINVRLVEESCHYVPTKNIMRGAELIGVYGRKYWDC